MNSSALLQTALVSAFRFPRANTLLDKSPVRVYNTAELLLRLGAIDGSMLRAAAVEAFTCLETIMHVSNRRRDPLAWILSGLMLLAICTPPLPGEELPKPQREQIGKVLGKPVYRDEMSKKAQTEDELHRLFMTPVLQVYVDKHKSLFEPTEEEIVAFLADLDKQRGPELKALVDRQKAEIAKLIENTRTQIKAAKIAKKSRELTPEEKEFLEAEPLLADVQFAAMDPESDRLFAVETLKKWKFQKHLHQRFGGGRIRERWGGIEAVEAFCKWLEAHEQQGDFQITDQYLRTRFYSYWTWQDYRDSDDPEDIKRMLLEPDWLGTSN